MKRVIFLLLAVFLCLAGLQGCASGSSGKGTVKKEDAATAATVKTDKAKSNSSYGASRGMTKITMTSGAVVIEAELDNENPAARAFIERLPLSLPMKEYGGREYYSRIGELPDGAGAIPDFSNGDVTYYPNGPSLAIFYAKAGSSHQGGLIRMGRITSDLGLFAKFGPDPVLRFEVVRERKSESVVMTEENEKAALRKFYDETWEAMVAKDMPKLDEQHAEQFVLVHMTGMRQPKQEFLKAIEKGDLNYYKSVPENVVITVNGNTAKIVGQNKVTAAVFGGSTNVWRLQLDFDAVKENGKWRMTYCKASTY